MSLSRAGKLVSWEHVLLKEVLRVTMLALALALLCSSVVFLEQVVSGKLMWLFKVDHYISWKNQLQWRSCLCLWERLCFA